MSCHPAISEEFPACWIRTGFAAVHAFFFLVVEGTVSPSLNIELQKSATRHSILDNVESGEMLCLLLLSTSEP
jgi:hypothetical protein